MKTNFNEKEKLPLLLKYITKFGNNQNKVQIHYLKSEKYKTDFMSQNIPNKALIRLI